MKIQKKRPRWKIWLWNKSRQIALVVLEFLWKRVIRFFYKPDFIFLVYGQERHKRACWSERTERRRGLLGLIGFISYRKNGKKLRGLILASTKSMEEFNASATLAVTVTDEVRRRFPQVGAIALAGQMPGWLARSSGVLPQQPFIGGRRGTCFVVRQAVREITSGVNSPTQLCVAVAGGAGHTGSEVVRVLAEDHRRVIAFDPRFKDEEAGNVVYTNNPRSLGEANVVVVLTAKGDDIEEVARHLNLGAIVADDTHPMMSKQIRKLFIDRGVPVFKITVADGSVSMFPRLPDFKRDDVPGCLLEALVVKLGGSQVIESQEAFNRAAEELGFKARLEVHPDYS
ncbi:MAG: hypothetical protein AAB797_02370 [Patescibacteria group bacterium]